MTVDRETIVSTLYEILGHDKFHVSQCAIGLQTNPDMRLRINKRTGLRLAAVEVMGLRASLTQLDVQHGLKRASLKVTNSRVVIDYLVAENPMLQRTPAQRARSKQIGDAIDRMLDLLDLNPIIKVATLEAMLLGLDIPKEISDRAWDFCKRRSLIHIVPIISGAADSEQESSEREQLYVIHGGARMKVSGSQAQYQLMLLLETAASTVPQPKRQRGTPVQHGRKRALQDREREQAHGYRSAKS